MLTVAHLVSPYLFQTGSWIHAQLIHARDVRPIVLTQQLEAPERFPFEPLLLVTASLGGFGKMRNRCLHLWGRYDPRLYLPLLAAEGVGLLHAHLGWEGARALPVARRAGLPLVTSFYGRDAGRLPRYPWWRLRFRQLFREGAAFFVEGPALGRRLAALGCPPEKIAVRHLGIDPAGIPFRTRHDAGEAAIEILVSASLRPKKGVLAAVNAFAAVAAAFPRARLRILGDGPQRRRIEQAIRHHRLGDRIVMEGYVSYERHLAALAEAHIFMAPSRTAPDGDSEGGAPVALIEAQAAGLPVLATQHADIPEVVAAGRSGLLSPEFDDGALTRNLEWLLANPQQWAPMGSAGRRRIETEFDAHRLAQQSAALYAAIAAGGAPSTSRAASARGR
jgi:colanic acid/amylovoran biosynthesis glycosyltransferase